MVQFIREFDPLLRSLSGGTYQGEVCAAGAFSIVDFFPFQTTKPPSLTSSFALFFLFLACRLEEFD